MIEFLNRNINELLHSYPFCEWVCEEENDEDLFDDEDLADLEKYITFSNKGLEILYDEIDTIQTIFIRNDFDMSLLTINPIINFSFNRKTIREKFGDPSFSGEPFTDEYLGKCGAWDRYDNQFYVVHFSYEIESEIIKLITIMTPEIAP